MIAVQSIPTGLLVQEYREALLTLGRSGDTASLGGRAGVLEEEILRRMAW